MFRLIYTLVAALLLAPAALAQLTAPPLLSGGDRVPPPDSLFRWNLASQSDGAAPRLVFDFTIAPGWKLYAMDSPAGRPLDITFDELPEGVTARGFEQSPPIEGYDPNFDADIRYFEASARVAARFRVGEKAASGPQTVGGTVTFMLCNDVMCLPPRTRRFASEIEVRAVEVAGGKAAAPAPSAAPASPEPLVSVEEDAIAEVAPVDAAPTVAGVDAAAAAPVAGGSEAAGMGAFLLLAFGAGFAALLTPCVFPLIPLTVATFSKGEATASRRGVGRALAFGGAMIVLFTLLGGAASALLGAAGAQQVAANPWVNLALGVAFVVFALALLGLIELRLPAGWVNAVDRAGREHRGAGGMLLAALAVALVSFSCTAPFIGGLLATAATGGWARPLVGMAAFSTSFALPFVVLAAAPGLVARLPRSGSWMTTLKAVLGFVELGAALKFLSNADLVWGLGVLTRPTVIALTMAVAALLAFYLLGRFQLRHEPAVVGVGAGRLLGALAALGAVLLLLPGLSGGRVPLFDAYLPPATEAPASTGTLPAASAWFTDDLDGARAEAAATGMPLFVDFTGYTCTNCRAMEANVFPAPEVAPVLAGAFVRVRLYTDARPHGPTFQKIQQEMTGTTAMPTYAILSPEGEVVGIWSGMASAEAFGAFLREAAARAA